MIEFIKGKGINWENVVTYKIKRGVDGDGDVYIHVFYDGKYYDDYFIPVKKIDLFYELVCSGYGATISNYAVKKIVDEDDIELWNSGEYGQELIILSKKYDLDIPENLPDWVLEECYK